MNLLNNPFEVPDMAGANHRVLMFMLFLKLLDALENKGDDPYEEAPLLFGRRADTPAQTTGLPADPIGMGVL